MADVSDPAITEAIRDVRADHTDTDWCSFGYVDKTTLGLDGSGSGGFNELMHHLKSDKVEFCLLRLVDGDMESRRVKFIFLTWVGENVGGLARGRVGSHVGSVKSIMGLTHIDLRADNAKECSLDVIKKKLKVAGGADYDTGSNAAGYQSSGNIKSRALEAYQEKEREGNIKKVVYVTSALPSVTPVDLGGRPTVAPSSEAKRNTADNVVNTKKYVGSGTTGTTGPSLQFDDKLRKPATQDKPSPAAAKPAPAEKPAPAAKPAPAEKPALGEKPSIATKPAAKPKPALPPKSAEAPELRNEAEATPLRRSSSMYSSRPARPISMATPSSVPQHAEQQSASERRWSILDGPLVEDPEERARLRAEARRQRRHDEGKQEGGIAEESHQQRASAAEHPLSEPAEEPAHTHHADPEPAAPKPAPKAAAEPAHDSPVEHHASVEHHAPAPEPEKPKPAVQAAAAPASNKSSAAKKPKSLFDDDDEEDENDLFKPKDQRGSKEASPQKAGLFGDYDAEESVTDKPADKPAAKAAVVPALPASVSVSSQLLVDVLAKFGAISTPFQGTEAELIHALEQALSE